MLKLISENAKLLIIISKYYPAVIMFLCFTATFKNERASHL